MYIELKSKNVKIWLLPVGATIYKTYTKDKYGNFKNIVLSLDNIEDYEKNNVACFGATCGRVAGRIADGRFEIDGKVYELTKNENNKTTLHGGVINLSNVVWDYSVSYGEESSSCIFTYSSKDLDEGFPGNVYFNVEYILKDNKLDINYYAKSDRKTYINLTNHSYFNLSDEEFIYNHKLRVNSDRYLRMNEDCIPTGFVPTKNTDFDFNILKTIGNLSLSENVDIKSSMGFNHAFLLNRINKNFDLYLEDLISGRSIKVKTTYPYIVLYTYNFATNGDKKHSAISIEPQYPPNAMNDPRLFIDLVDKDKPYKHNIQYIFNVNKI